MNSISTKEDIIKELSIETGISEKELKEVVDLNIKYIKNKAVTSDYTIIRLPKLCTIRFNYRLGKSSLVYKNKLKKKETTISKIQSLESKIRILEDVKSGTDNWMDLLNFSNPLFERLWRKYKKIKYIKFLYTKSNSIIEELEIKTNEIINKIS